MEYIELLPLFGSNAELKVKKFYYSDKLSISLRNEITNVDVDELEFIFIHEDASIEKIIIPVEPLFTVDEMWVDLIHYSDRSKLYTKKVFDTYSYYVANPF